MLDTFIFFCDELEKEAMSPDARRRKRRMYYQRNRNKILRRNAIYRTKNRATRARKAKLYRRRVHSGAIRQRKRQKVGHGYMYTGMR